MNILPVKEYLNRIDDKYGYAIGTGLFVLGPFTLVCAALVRFIIRGTK